MDIFEHENIMQKLEIQFNQYNRQVEKLFKPPSWLAQIVETMNKPAIWMNKQAAWMAELTGRIGSLSTPPTWVNNFTKTIIERPAWLERLYETSGLDEVMADLYYTFPDETDYDWENESIELTAPDKADISEAVQIAITKPENWQIALRDRIAAWSVKNPVIAWVFHQIILAIIISIVATGIAEVIRNTPLRQNPSSDALIIITIVEKQVIVIVNEDVPYWYEVEYEDAETGEKCSGWVSKRSIQRADNCEC